MGANLDCNDYEAGDEKISWQPFIGFSTDSAFVGVFDGNGYSISNLVTLAPGGLFHTIASSSRVENLTFYDAHIKSGVSGVVAITNQGEISNVLVKNSKVTDEEFNSGDDYKGMGMLVADNQGVVKYCISAGNKIIRDHTADEDKHEGMLIGKNSNEAEIFNCVSVGDSMSTAVDGSAHRVVGDSSGTIKNNYAYSGTLINDIVLPYSKTGFDTRNGRSTSRLAYRKAFYENLSIDVDGAFRWPDSNNPTLVYVPVGKNVPAAKDEGYVFLGEGDPNTFSQGDGTMANPYLVEDRIDLDNIRYGLELNYKLVENINVSVNKFKPLGTKDAPFRGTFDGDYHSVSAINHIVIADGEAGLFGYLQADKENRFIKNLAIMNTTIDGDDYFYVGAFAGQEFYLTEKPYKFENLLGYNNTIKKVGVGAGGIVGAAQMATIKKCVVVGGKISGEGIVGGIGRAKRIENCATIIDTIVVTNRISGNRLGQLTSKMSKDETGIGWYFTEIVGRSDYSPKNETGTDGRSAFAWQLSDSSYWQNLGFTEKYGWKFAGNDPFQIAPTLKNMDSDVVPTTEGLSFTSGAGIADDPYKITSPRQLNLLHLFTDDPTYIDKHIQLTIGETDNTVDFSDWEADWRKDFNGRADGNWRPVENFTAGFDGNGGGVVGLYVQEKCNNKQGFFASIGNGGAVKQFGIYNSTFSGCNGFVGALAGEVANGRIMDAMVVGTIIKNGSTVGGVVGKIVSPEPKRDVFLVISANNTIERGSVVGGVVGEVAEGDTLKNSAALFNTITPTNGPQINCIIGKGTGDNLLCETTMTKIGGGSAQNNDTKDATVYSLDALKIQATWDNSAFVAEIFRGTDGTRSYPTLSRVPLSVDNGNYQ